MDREIERFLGHVDWRRVKAERALSWTLDTYRGPGFRAVRPHMLRHHGRPAQFVEGMFAWEMAATHHIAIQYLSDDTYTLLDPYQWLAGNPEEVPYGDE